MYYNCAYISYFISYYLYMHYPKEFHNFKTRKLPRTPLPIKNTGCGYVAVVDVELTLSTLIYSGLLMMIHVTVSWQPG